MKEGKIEFEFVEDAEQAVRALQGVVQQSLMTRQAQFTQNYGINTILNKQL